MQELLAVKTEVRTNGGGVETVTEVGGEDVRKAEENGG